MYVMEGDTLQLIGKMQSLFSNFFSFLLRPLTDYQSHILVHNLVLFEKKKIPLVVSVL